MACWATKMGCPRIGVADRSFCGSASASRSITKSLPCSRTTAKVFSFRYVVSLARAGKRLRNLLCARATNHSSGRASISSSHLMPPDVVAVLNMGIFVVVGGSSRERLLRFLPFNHLHAATSSPGSFDNRDCVASETQTISWVLRAYTQRLAKAGCDQTTLRPPPPADAMSGSTMCVRLISW